jgi:hypothetical protein
MTLTTGYSYDFYLVSPNSDESGSLIEFQLAKGFTDNSEAEISYIFNEYSVFDKVSFYNMIGTNATGDWKIRIETTPTEGNVPSGTVSEWFITY